MRNISCKVYDRDLELVSTEPRHTSNMAIPHEDVVQNYLEREVSLGRMHCVGEAAKGQLQVQISPLGMIPKKNKLGKWRLIVDLSSPKGHSVNDGINLEYCSLEYTTVDMLAELVLQVGQGALLVKADIKEAYRNIPVHPEDQQLLGIRWNGWVYIDRVLPFGLRSAPKIFSAVADAAQWMMVQWGISDVLHYLDDFALVAPDVGSAQQAKGEMCRLFSSLGLPLEPNKLEGPSTCLTFLGIKVRSAGNSAYRQRKWSAWKRNSEQLGEGGQFSSVSYRVSQVYCSTAVMWSDQVEPSSRGYMLCRVWDPPLLTISG